MHLNGCQPNLATDATNDYTDNVCIRCPRNEFAPKGAPICTECPRGTIKKVSGQFTLNTQMLNIPTFYINGYNPWYYIQNEQGYQSADCALMPPGIIHIPGANYQMTYERPNFLAAMACPFGLSSRPGSFAIVGLPDLVSLLGSNDGSVRSVIQAPYIRFDQTYTLIEEVTTCKCGGYSSISRTMCQNYLRDEGIDTMLDRVGPSGCFKHASRPGVGFFGASTDKEFPSTAITYICRSGANNDALAGTFARANCFRCPGNSMTGPSSTTCTTCFANQLKQYAKEAVQKFAEDTLPSLKPDNAAGDAPMEFSANLPNYALVYKADDQGYKATHEFVPRRDSDKTELSLADCYLACSSLEQTVSLIAVGILESDSSKCACSTEHEKILPPSVVMTNQEAIDWTYQYYPTWQPLYKKNGDTNLYSSSQRHYSGVESIFQNNWESTEQLHYVVGGTYGSSAVNPVPHDYFAPYDFYVEKMAGSNYNFIGYKGAAPTASTASGTNTEYVWSRITGSLDDGGYPSWGEEALPLCSACQPGKRTDSGCQSCDPGMYTETPAQADKLNCQKCSSGRYTPTKGSIGCMSCPLGFKQQNIASKTCDPCGPGFYQDIAGKVTCKSCPAGYYSKDSSSPICASCDAGQIQPNEESITCTGCDIGKYTTEKGSIQCLRCEPGKYGNRTSADSCVRCPRGYFQMAVESTDCTICESGTFSLIGGSACLDCTEGFFQSNPGAYECETCDGGKACGQKSHGAACPSNKYQKANTWDSCESCSVDKEVSSDQTECDPCGSGKSTYGKSGTTCQDCPDEGWTPVIWVENFGRDGYLHSCSQFYNEIGPLAGTAGNAGEPLQVACESGRTTDDNICDGLQGEKRTACHWGRKLNEEGIKGMTTTYETSSPFGKSTVYHRCLFGLGMSGSDCNGYGGERRVKTYITARETATYTFTSTIWDVGTVEFEFLTDGSRGTISHSLYGGSRTDTIPMQRGDRIAITLRYEKYYPFSFTGYGLGYLGAMTMEPANLLITHRANPVSNYCGLNS